MPVLLLAALAHADPAEQMLTNSQGLPLRWTAMPVRFHIDAGNTAGLPEEATVAAIVEAAAAWTFVDDAQVEYRFVGTESGAQGGYDDHSVVFFAEEWDGSPDLLAVTSTWSNEAGEILDFDLAINTADHGWSLDGDPEAGDLQNTLAHEFGHALGFGHDDAHTEATMFPSARPGELTKRDLADSDLEIARYAYPPIAEAVEEKTTPTRMCATSGAGSGLATLTALLPLLLRRRSVRPC